VKTTTVEALLGLLSGGPLSGYEIKKRIGESIGNFWSESFGQIYPTLKEMVAEGLAKVEDSQGTGGRERKRYRLTDAGRNRLREWLTLPAMDQVPRNELLLKLFFGNRAEQDNMKRLVETKKAELSANLKRFEAIEAGIAAGYAGHPGLPYWLMTVRYGKAEAVGLIAWCDECLGTFKEMQ